MDSQLQFFDAPPPAPPAVRIANFLKSMQGSSKAKYKRYRGLPLRYAGGKSLAVAHIMEHLPPDTKRVMSPFIGGGSVEIAFARELGIEVQGYDIFEILVAFWQSILTEPDKLSDTIAAWEATAEQYQIVKRRLKSHWDGEAKLSNKTELAAHYWFNHNLSFGPAFLGWMSSAYRCPRKIARQIKMIREFRCSNLNVAVGTFANTIPAHPNDFLYCDPPYYLQEGKMFKGIYPSRNITIYHDGFDHLKLHELLMAHEGGFILSYNDCKTIRDLYKNCKIHEVSWQYTMGQGETRIGKNRLEGNQTNIKKSHEILIVRKPL